MGANDTSTEALRELFAAGRDDELLARLAGAAPASTTVEASALAANAAIRARRWADAAAWLGEVFSTRPGDVAVRRALATALSNVGAAHAVAVRHAAASDAFARALAVDPDNVDALYNSAMLALEANRWSDALGALARAHALRPADPVVELEFLAVALDAGDEDAEAHFVSRASDLERALPLSARLAEVEAAVGAAAALARVHALPVDAAGARGARRVAAAFAAAGEGEGARSAAEAAWSRACATRGIDAVHDWFDARLALPRIYRDAAHARAEYARFNAVAMDAAAALSAGEPDGIQPALEQLGWRSEALAYLGGDDREVLTALGDAQAALSRRVDVLPRAHDSARTGRVRRIGFVGTCFRAGTPGRWFSPWADGLAKAGFEVHAWQLTPASDELATALAARLTVHDAAAPASVVAAAIARAGLDAIVYPEVGFDARVTRLATLRLAPLQIAGWGLPQTTGLPTMDRFLTMAAMEPSDGASHYREALWPLPGVGTRYAAIAPPPPASRESLALPDGRLYAVLQTSAKLHPGFDDVLAAIAAEDAQATVLLAAPSSPQARRVLRARLSRAFAERGVNAEVRVRLVPRTGRVRFQQVLAACDVNVDTLHWSGGNTTLEAIALGVPTVTVRGRFLRGRQSAGMLEMLGLGRELVVDDAASLAATAVRAARAGRGAFATQLAASRELIFDRDEPVVALAGLLASM